MPLELSICTPLFQLFFIEILNLSTLSVFSFSYYYYYYSLLTFTQFFILFFQLVNERWDVKIADFGLSQVKAIFDDSSSHPVVGTAAWGAPEVYFYFTMNKLIIIIVNFWCVLGGWCNRFFFFLGVEGWKSNRESGCL